ncbi:DUF4062 domain-containing protein [Acinetobacter baumannii]|uniref:DUF4062 domain-containing protein n=1 Tax=Acinetobacter TaxID=469 RepID=UPI00028E2E6F|nr:MULTISPECIES: DUF4062 domain-containing protein [Acinetobacter]EHU1293795.1 DUF4062 domain-containing protein [Acinetobacter baumannii]EHU1349393.1 DUF4062 domain-containing protein [Acinetobacter baumannii]EHU1493311.1 DUF4062 domain-containing protein [Acinetobacter baumannii]EHU1497243.1 DUF4062 domain-containing protein [Acinetobacter baumannii]EHU1533045.1 DUF4062 domain-containing protein [Acinetobacter baumannii]
MLDTRYQIFISTSGREMQPERMVLSQTLVNMGFFAWGLEYRNPLTTTLARRQIDESDYVVLLLGSQYGEQSISGASYFSLEYEYALSRAKPIVVFMHEQPESRDMHLQETHPQLKEKFLAFRKKLLHEANHIFYFKSPRDLELAVRLNMPLMVEQYMGQGWVPARQAHHLEDEINRLKSKILQLEQQLSESSIQANEVAPQDVFAFEYQIQAFQDGNFKELKRQRQMTWSQLLSILAKHFETAMPEENFGTCLNEYLNQDGLEDARQELPRAHAVAGAQINHKALFRIKKQMQSQGWIVPTKINQQHSLWKVTTKAQKLLLSYKWNHRSTRLKA